MHEGEDSGGGGRRQMSMLGISMEKWIILMIVIFLCCIGRKFSGPDERNIQTIMAIIQANAGLAQWGFTRDAEIQPVYTFLTENINLLQRTRGQRADRLLLVSLSWFLLDEAYFLQRYFIRRVRSRD
jgi:hypothetical protein